MKKYAFLLAHQRSGSHFLGHCIGSHPDIAYVDELTRIKSRKLLKKQLKTKEALLSLLEEKFGDRKEPIILVDVKYNNMLRVIEDLMKVSKVINLFRENKLNTYYSAVHAHYRKKHKLSEYTEGGEVVDVRKRPKAFPDCIVDDELISYLIRKEFAFEKKYGYLIGLKFSYEQLTNNQHVNSLSSWARKKICNFLEVKEHPLKAKTIKMSPSDVKPYLKDL